MFNFIPDWNISFGHQPMLRLNMNQNIVTHPPTPVSMTTDCSKARKAFFSEAPPAQMEQAPQMQPEPQPEEEVKTSRKVGRPRKKLADDPELIMSLISDKIISSFADIEPTEGK